MAPEVPVLPDNHFTNYEPEPVEVLPYRAPKTPLPTRVLVPGKPVNRAYRRAEAAVNKRAVEKVKKARKATLGRITAAQASVDALLQPTTEPGTDQPSPDQESST